MFQSEELDKLDVIICEYDLVAFSGIPQRKMMLYVEYSAGGLSQRDIGKASLK